MDSRELLKKYIAHVVDCQGVDFIASGRTTSAVSFTEDERRELDQLSEAVEVDIVLRDEPAQEEWPTLVNQASPNLIALFRLIGAYLRDTGPVQMEFRDSDRAITTAQDAFLRHLADRVLVISDAVLTDTTCSNLMFAWDQRMTGDLDHDGEIIRQDLIQLARGEDRNV